jgi:alanine dehydrogenase
VPGTLIIPRSTIRRVLGMRECIDAVERAFRSQASGDVVPPRITGSHVEGGGFHVKTCGLLDPPVYAAKINANFPRNPARHGLPTVQGVVALFDAERGSLLALLDSGEITRLRTAAASAVAARYLARADARTLTICGCGVQGRAHLEALSLVRRIDIAYGYDVDPAASRRFASEMSVQLGLDVRPSESLSEVTRRSDMVAMCTTSREILLRPDDVADGAFIAAVGADSEDKRELDPALVARSRVVVDDLEQCLTIGELHHALDAGLMTAGLVAGDLSALVSNRIAGRRNDDEITIFDSTGTALEDVAAAALVFDRVAAAEDCASIDLSG